MKARGIFVSLVVMATTWTVRARSEQRSAQIQRGKYLVESVAMCGDCHTPHNEKGEPIQEKWLQGSMLPFKPAIPIPVWADKTPKIAGLPGWEDRDAIKFLMTGLAYNDLPARPPMPQYRSVERRRRRWSPICALWGPTSNRVRWQNNSLRGNMGFVSPGRNGAEVCSSGDFR